VKNYKQGNKTSQALFKQGLAFKLLGDKTSASLLFQQVIKDYPNTNQARTARAYLLEIK
jgi:TolA-binding protein